ncbi:MAG: DUF1214 domain-containing protein [Nocardioides sp.]
MRSFSTFRNDLPSEDLQAAEAARLRSLATWSYLLLRPGMEFVRQRSNFVLGWQAAAAAAGGAVDDGVSAGAVGRAGVPAIGSWMVLPTLTSPATQTVLPSYDALYGAAHLELDRSGPIVAAVPAAPDERYFSVAVMDAHMNNVGHIGPRWTGWDEVQVLLVPPGWTGTAPAGMVTMKSSTASVCLYNRMVVRDPHDADDLDLVRAWQAGLRLVPLARWGTDDESPADVPVDDLVHPTINTLTDGVDYLRIGLEHLRRNPLVEPASWLSDLVQDAGFEAAAADPVTRGAIEQGLDDATAILDARLTTWPRRHGWMVPDLELGLPNPKVDVAAAFQQFQIGSNNAAESVYWFGVDDADGRRLDASESSYTLRFAGDDLPPVHDDGGYWSLTMYDEHSFLVANDQDRYRIWWDTPGLVLDPDGSVTIHLSASAPIDVPTGNWLPAPTGPFRLGLRMYYPRLDHLERGWTPPAAVRTSG